MQSIYIKRYVCPPIMFCLSPHTHSGGGTNIFVGAGGGSYDVDDHEEEEEDVSEASKLSAGARI